MGDAKRKRERLKREAEIAAIERSYAEAESSSKTSKMNSVKEFILLFIFILFNLKGFIKWKIAEKAKQRRREKYLID